MAGGTARHAGLYQDNIPILVARDRKRATSDAVLSQVDRASVGAALANHAGQSSHRRRWEGDRRFRPQSRDSVLLRAGAGKAGPEPSHLYINNVNAYQCRLKQWLNRFNGVGTKNLPNYLAWRRALEAWGDQLAPPNWINGAIGNGRYQQLSLQEPEFFWLLRALVYCGRLSCDPEVPRASEASGECDWEPKSHKRAGPHSGP